MTSFIVALDFAFDARLHALAFRFRHRIRTFLLRQKGLEIRRISSSTCKIIKYRLRVIMTNLFVRACRL